MPFSKKTYNVQNVNNKKEKEEKKAEKKRKESPLHKDKADAKSTL